MPTASAATLWPNFYLVGAPKSGTTSLYEYLSLHPRIIVPERKESFFFGSDLDIRWPHRLDGDAFRMSYARANSDSVTGAAFVWYLFSRMAADEIAEVRPDARIIVMLRNPVEMLYSLHGEFLYNGNEDIEDFSAALAAEADRAAGRRIPNTAHFPAALRYRMTVRYAEQVKRYLARFGPDRVLVLFFDDFAADPAGAYRQALRFLGLEFDERQSFPRRNPSKRSRSRFVRRLLATPPPRLRRAVKILIPSDIRRRAYRTAVALNMRTAIRPPLAPQVRSMLMAELAPGVEELESLLGRDLTSWRKL